MTEEYLNGVIERNKRICFALERMESISGKDIGFSLCGSDGKILKLSEAIQIFNLLREFYDLVSDEDIDECNDYNMSRMQNQLRTISNITDSESKSKPGFVYLLTCGLHTKIGVSTDVDKRIDQLATIPPFDIELLHKSYVEDSYGIEGELHERYAAKRKNGEWFTLSGEDKHEIIEYLKGIEATEQTR